MKGQDDIPKQSLLHVLKNICWMLKYVFKYAQTLAWDKVIRIPITAASSYININLARWILDSVELGNFGGVVLRIVMIYSVLIAGNCIMSVMAVLVNPQKKINLCTGIRKELIEKIGRIDQLNFQNPKFFDDYTLALNEIDNRAVQVLETVGVMITSIISFFVITGTAAGINSRYAIFSIIAAYFDVALGMIRQKLSYRQTLETTPDGRKRGYIGRVTYQPEFTADLKVYPQFHRLLIFKYEQAAQNIKRIIYQYAKKIIWIDQAQKLTGVLFKGMLPWIWIAWLLIRQEISIAEAAVLSSAAISLPETFQKYLSNFQNMYSHSLYIEKLKQLFSFGENIERDDEGRTELRQPVSIALEDVSFAYAPDMPAVLKRVSLEIGHGEKIAIVGFNGAGKTTLAKLMIRLYDCTEGRLSVNRQPIDTYSVKSLRSRIIYLSQDYKIYGFSIAENILMRPVSGEEDVKLVHSALRRVGLYEKVSGFPSGINTCVTREFDSEGVYFSGGEQQKLALARVYAGNYDFVILDEATSALDPVSEDEILKMIFDMFDDKTIVMISHRLAAIQYVNHVYFMEEGEMKEEGTHRRLMELQGQYAEFYLTQAEKYESK